MSRTIILLFRSITEFRETLSRTEHHVLTLSNTLTLLLLHRQHLHKNSVHITSLDVLHNASLSLHCALRVICVDPPLLSGQLGLRGNIVAKIRQKNILLVHLVHNLPRLLNSPDNKGQLLLQIFILVNFDLHQLIFQ